MNQKAVANLVRFALAAAARFDHRVDLGPIHLMKLLFLADWAYARGHGGETYTGITWKFHNYGPYCDGVVEELERAAPAAGAQDRSFYGLKSGKDVKRWASEKDEATDDLFLELERILPAEVVRAIKSTIQNHGNATYPLLHDVYGTLPMRRTAPGEMIDFRAAIQDPPNDPGEDEQDPPPVTLNPVDPGISTTQRKKQEKTFELLRLRMKEALQRSHASNDLLYIEPLEDEVFEQGMAWLDPMEGTPQSFHATFNIHSSVWHSSTRRSMP